VDPLTRDIVVTLDLAIARYRPDGTLVSLIDPPFDQPVNLEFDQAGRLVVMGTSGEVGSWDPDSVIVLNPAGELVRRVSVPWVLASVTADGGTL
jgi:hypothetical protein